MTITRLLELLAKAKKDPFHYFRGIGGLERGLDLIDSAEALLGVVRAADALRDAVHGIANYRYKDSAQAYKPMQDMAVVALTAYDAARKRLEGEG